MLGRGAKSDSTASFAVVWANLRKRPAGSRRILVTAASSGDDATMAALALADAAVRLDGASGLVLVVDSARRNRRVPQSPAPSVRIMVAVSPTRVRAIVSQLGEQFDFVIVVAPPPQRGPDCISVAAVADAAILVTRSGGTRFGEAQLAAELLRQAGVMTVAALLLTRRIWKSGKSVDAPAFEEPGQIAELRPRADVTERREASAGVELLS